MSKAYLPRETDCNGVPLLPDTQRLDVIWQQLIAERDALKKENKSLRKALEAKPFFDLPELPEDET